MEETRPELMARQEAERAKLAAVHASERAELKARERIAAALAWRRRFRHRQTT